MFNAYRRQSSPFQSLSTIQVKSKVKQTFGNVSCLFQLQSVLYAPCSMSVARRGTQLVGNYGTSMFLLRALCVSLLLTTRQCSVCLQRDLWHVQGPTFLEQLTFLSWVSVLVQLLRSKLCSLKYAFGCSLSIQPWTVDTVHEIRENTVHGIRAEHCSVACHSRMTVPNPIFLPIQNGCVSAGTRSGSTGFLCILNPYPPKISEEKVDEVLEHGRNCSIYLLQVREAQNRTIESFRFDL